MIRISSGQFKGALLTAPRSIRPTEARVRQALFNILQHVIAGSVVLDGFAGSGALGIEALSRDAKRVTFLEQDNASIIAIRDNLDRLGDRLPRAAWRVMQSDVERGIELLAQEGQRFDVIFLDPPYGGGEAIRALNALARYVMLAPAGFLAVEHHRRDILPASAGSIKQLKQHRYGETVLSLYQAAPEATTL